MRLVTWVLRKALTVNALTVSLRVLALYNGWLRLLGALHKLRLPQDNHVLSGYRKPLLFLFRVFHVLESPLLAFLHLYQPNLLVSNSLKLKFDPLLLGKKVDGSSFLQLIWFEWLHICPELGIYFLQLHFFFDLLLALVAFHKHWMLGADDTQNLYEVLLVRSSFVEVV